MLLFNVQGIGEELSFLVAFLVKGFLESNKVVSGNIILKSHVVDPDPR